MNTICSQCGSVLASGESTCSFCDATEVLALPEQKVSTKGNLALSTRTHEEWRGELNQRLQAYRARRRKTSPNEAQTALPFDDHVRTPLENIAIEVEEPPCRNQVPGADDFAFTIAIGRVAKQPGSGDPRVMIDVSVPPRLESPVEETSAEPLQPVQNGLFPIATLDERRHALLIDAACLAFAYGGFLALFGSLGGHFTLSKLSATVCFFTFAFVYLQYFGLFTVFGGSTPGMMVSGIQVASFTGDIPTPRQYMMRAVGYLLSAGTCFLGFLWVVWDEDGLTWHDRLSKTYLARIELLGELVEEDLSPTAAAR
ncbi:MAG: RDD family protein [Candidatus Acidiferrum sp.]